MPITLDELYTIPDILPTTKFVFDFNAQGVGSGHMLGLKCKDIKFPSPGQIEPIKKELFGHASNYKGRKISSHLITGTFFEDSAGGTMMFLKSCFDTLSDENGNAIAHKKGYVMHGSIVVEDTTGRAVITATPINMWFSNVESFNLDGGSSAPAEVPFEITYDYVDFEFHGGGNFAGSDDNPAALANYLSQFSGRVAPSNTGTMLDVFSGAAVRRISV